MAPASLDRIDSDLKVYAPSNVRWVSANQNLMRMTLPDNIYLEEYVAVTLNVLVSIVKRVLDLCR